MQWGSFRHEGGHHLITKPKRTFYFFPTGSDGLRFGGADFRPCCFTLGMQTCFRETWRSSEEAKRTTSPAKSWGPILMSPNQILSTHWLLLEILSVKVMTRIGWQLLRGTWVRSLQSSSEDKVVSRPFVVTVVWWLWRVCWVICLVCLEIQIEESKVISRLQTIFYHHKKIMKSSRVRPPSVQPRRCSSLRMDRSQLVWSPGIS